MPLVVVGLHHRSAPLGLLEKVAVDRDHLAKALLSLRSLDAVTEGVVLSTCMRTELYAVVDEYHSAMADLRDLMASWASVPPEELVDHLYCYWGSAAVGHLFRVAAGLDSVVVGEGEILSQVRQAWSAAAGEGAAGTLLSGLFRHAVEVGKRARAQTGISKGVTSLSSAGVAYAKERLGSLEGLEIVVVGAGDMGAGMARSLAGSGASIVIVNRTRARAESLANRLGGRAMVMQRLPDALARADVVFCALQSRSFVVGYEDLLAAGAGGSQRELLVVDLALPRNVDPAVATIGGVHLADLDEIGAFVQVALTERREHQEAVEGIVEAEVARFDRVLAARRASPVVSALRARGESVVRAELERHRGRLADLQPEQMDAVEALTRSIVAKLLHSPTVTLKETAGSTRGERLAEAVTSLFEL